VKARVGWDLIELTAGQTKICWWQVVKNKQLGAKATSSKLSNSLSISNSGSLLTGRRFEAWTTIFVVFRTNIVVDASNLRPKILEVLIYSSYNVTMLLFYTSFIMADLYFFLLNKIIKMDSQNMKVLPFSLMEKKCEVNIFDYFFYFFKLETNALTKHLSCIAFLAARFFPVEKCVKCQKFCKNDTRRPESRKYFYFSTIFNLTD
jgi:hypothetical protein